MKFKPMSEQEARDASTPPPLADGEYDFEVASAEEKPSKSSGVMMFELQLRVFTPENKFRTIRDYVMTEGKAAWRLRECADGLGLTIQYEQGELSALDFEGVGGRCVLITQTDPSGQYSPQNRVKKYLPAKGARPTPKPATQQRQMAHADLDDEIPF